VATITAAVLAGNNEAIIADCLASVAWADERLVILDDRSDDGTEEICRSLGARVIANRFENFAEQRNFGFEQVNTEWLFYIDSDEQSTEALAAEIRQVMKEDVHVGWWVPRRNFIWGHETKHGGWYPDYQLRMYRVDRARYDPEHPVHEVVILQGEAGYLKEPLLHFNYATVAQFVAKQQQYVELEAGNRLRAGVRPKPWTIVTQPLREFWRYYVRLQGYKDGWHGLRLCSLVAYYYGYAVTARLKQLRQRRA
jgi:(heptosyl)LPS beta-1,4-glucosyltransferase